MAGISCIGIITDIEISDPDFSFVNNTERIVEAHTAVPDRFDLGTSQYNTCFKLVFDSEFKRSGLVSDINILLCQCGAGRYAYLLSLINQSIVWLSFCLSALRSTIKSRNP